MNTWNDDFELSKYVEPLQDAVYKKIWGDKITIERVRAGELDRLSHVDVTITLKHGQKIRGQEKALRQRYAGFNTFTLEYLQNRKTQEQGEWFSLDAHFYLTGYLSEDNRSYASWMIIDLLKFNQWINGMDEAFIVRHLRATTSSNASFIWVPVDLIPDECIIARSGA